MTTSIASLAEEDALRQCLERTAFDCFGGTSAIVAIHRSRFDLSTSYNTYLLTVQMASGAEIKVFLKDFGFSVRPKDGARQRRERELRVYQELLAEAELGTARYYG